MGEHPATTDQALDRLDHSQPWRFEIWSLPSAVSPGGELINRGEILAELDWHDHMVCMRELALWLRRFDRSGRHIGETRIYDKSGQRVVWDDGETPDA